VVPAYAELHCLSNFSFLRGASHPEELVLQAVRLGYSALAITDECSLAGVVRAHVEAKNVGLRLLIGSEFHISDGLRVVLLAQNLDGYGNLCELITKGRRQAPKGEYRLARPDLAIEDCLALWLPDAVPNVDDARWIANAFPGRAWAAAELLRGPDDAHQLHLIQETAGQVGIPVVAAGDVHMHVRQRRALQDVVTAVRIGKRLSEAGSALHPNGERHLRSIGRLANIHPPELLMETLAVAERCMFKLDEIRYQYPKEIVPDGESPSSHLRSLTYRGAATRYPAGIPPKVQGLIAHELELIADLEYEPYFLTVYDIVRFAREEKILCQGRGSAANSVVCYCLGITEVDPDRMQVLFERFISRERNEPPDIDVDFEHERREEVIQYIYTKYGRERAGMTAIAVTYRPKSALRDVGKALGFSLDQVDKLAGVMAWWDGRNVLPDRLMEAGFDPENPRVRMLQARVGELVGFPRHLSQHPGGFVLSGDLLSRTVPIENAAMPDRTVIQWDKDDLDALGLLKVDVLGLGMLSCIRGSLDLINRFRGSALRMQDIPAEDPAVYDMLCKGDSVGVFQVESRAQMSMLPRLKPRRFYDLVIEVAIVRPGPIQGGMVHPYLARRAGEQAVTYPSRDVEKVLERTLGVAIFQEQVMQLAIVAAGFSAGEADRLRRAMAAWRRKGGIEAFRQKLIDGMLAHGYDQAYAEQIYRMIQGFGEYGFPESHAASFALLVYLSSWIKRHEPAAFCAALLNAQPLGFYAPAQLVQDARRHGVELRPVDVTVSDWFSTLERGPSGEPVIRLGMHRVKGLKQISGERIVGARQRAAFTSIEDFYARVGIDRHDLDCLADGDALRSLAGHRRDALWSTLGQVAADAPISVVRSERQAELALPTEGEDVVADYRRLGLTLRRHPLALLRPHLQNLRVRSAAEVQRASNGSTIHTGGIVTCRQRPATASGVIFVTLEDETGNVNVVVWARVAERQRRELLASRLLGIVGEVQRVGDVVHVVARRLVDHSHLLGALPTASRDFH